MNPRGSARFCFAAAAMCIASLCRAGVWGAQPVIGVSADYSSNPALLDLPNTAESHADLLLDAPTTYVGDAFKLSLLPSFRLSNTQGYSSLDSDYEHLTASGEFDTERSVFTVTGLLARDSSLYHDYLLNGSTGVRRDTATADVNWDRHFTERFEIDADVNSTRVRYAEPAGVSTLTDFKYTSVTPTLAWAESERTRLTVSASAGRYNSLNGTAESTNVNLQFGFVQQLSEIWTLSANAGYSRANDELDAAEEVLESSPSGPIVVLIPFRVKSTQNGSVYSVNLGRQTSLLTLSISASRQLSPQGYVFLSGQDTYELKATYNKTERWSFSGDVRRIIYQTPGAAASGNGLGTTALAFSAAWRWTEQWTLTLNASRVFEHYGSPSIGISASGASVELSRQFNWKSLQ
jgi:hypothetical protein